MDEYQYKIYLSEDEIDRLIDALELQCINLDEDGRQLNHDLIKFIKTQCFKD